MLKLAAAQSGNLINLSEWGSIAGIGRDTVASYLEILESGHVVVPLPPFAGGRRSEITGTPKIFLVDNGIRNHLLYDFKALEERADAGAALENWIFAELWKALPRCFGLSLEADAWKDADLDRRQRPGRLGKVRKKAIKRPGRG